MTQRYSRQIVLPGFGKESQEKCSQAKVLIIGIGGLGCISAQYLVGAGIGTIGLMDFDTVDETNLQRQTLFTEKDIGTLKVNAALRHLKKYNSQIIFHGYPEKCTRENIAALISQYDIIVDAVDDSDTKYIINDTCILLKKPYVYGAIYQFFGQISVFNVPRKDGSFSPNLRSLFPTPDEIPLPNCNEAGILGSVAGIIGNIQAIETIKLITGIGELLSGKILIIDTLTWNTRLLNIKDCIIAPYPEKNIDDNYQKYLHSIEPTELQNMLLKKENIQLIDIRDTSERLIASLGGMHLPVALLGKSIEKIPRDIPVILYCHFGKNSALIQKFLVKTHHFTNIYNLQGGIDQFAKTVQNTLPTY